MIRHLRRCTFRTRRWSADDGTALVEFVVLVAFVIVPIVYAGLAVARVQSAAYAVTQAAREAGRAYVQADSPAQAETRARMAVSIAMADQGFDGAGLELDCGGKRCLEPGSTIRVQVSSRVRLPFLPDGIDAIGSVPVTAHHVVPVDEYRSSP